VPTPIGAGSRFRPAAHPDLLGPPRGWLTCTVGGDGDTAHLELFAEGKVVLLPAGIGLRPPLRRALQRIVSARCRFPIATFDRTGVIDFTRRGLTLGDVFAVWGERLSDDRLLSFRAHRGERVRAFVDGAPWPHDLRAIPLTHHAEIVVEVNGFVRPHRAYLFPR